VHKSTFSQASTPSGVLTCHRPPSRANPVMGSGGINAHACGVGGRGQSANIGKGIESPAAWIEAGAAVIVCAQSLGDIGAGNDPDVCAQFLPVSHTSFDGTKGETGMCCLYPTAIHCIAANSVLVVLAHRRVSAHRPTARVIVRLLHGQAFGEPGGDLVSGLERSSRYCARMRPTRPRLPRLTQPGHPDWQA